jgi:VanZ family protein
MVSKSNVNGFAFYWLPVLAYAGLIFYLSSIPSYGLPKWDFDMSILHVPLFFGLSYLILRALPSRGVPVWKLFALSIVVSTLYGVTDEIHQLFVPGREFSLVDMLFDFIGSSLILFKIRMSSNQK